MALLLSRKRNEVIRIGSNIVIQIADIRGNKVRLAITAPDDVKVLRGELPEQDSEKGNPDAGL